MHFVRQDCVILLVICVVHVACAVCLADYDRKHHVGSVLSGIRVSLAPALPMVWLKI